MKNQQKNQQGNALIIVLIAVILLAALSFAVTRGQQDGGGKRLLSEADSKLLAGKILKHARNIEAAVKKVQLVNGCSENEISFENSTVGGYTNTTPSPTDNSCHIFDVNGGGQTWFTPDNGFSNWIITGSVTMRDLGDNSTTPELSMTFPNITQNLCIELNDQLGITNPSNIPPIDINGLAVTQFVGTFSNDNALGDVHIALINEKSYCFQDSSDNSYHFFHSLIAR